MTPWGGRRVPFTLLGGYLGAGKTTVLNHLIRHGGGGRLVVLVNDVGTVNVDADLVADHDGITLSLTNGCVCCSIADDLGLTLEIVRDLPEPPDQVVMELSGVAEPARVAPWADTSGFRIDGIVVVADAEQLPDQVEHEYVGDTVRAQLTAADLVLLTKTDLAPGDAATSVIAGLTSAPIVPTANGVVDPQVVFGVPVRSHRVPLTTPVGYVTETVTIADLDFDGIRNLTQALPADVIRAKGLLRCSDVDHPVEVHAVGPRRNLHVRRDLPLERASADLVVIRLAGARHDQP